MTWIGSVSSAAIALCGYAADANIDVTSERAGRRVLRRRTTFIEQRLKLTVNRAKSAVAPPKERQFLGFSFTSGPEIRRRIAPHALVRFKQRVRTLTNRNRGRSMETVVEQRAPYLNGWGGYVGFCQTRSVLQGLDSWIRRRLRCVIWTQWKTPRRRITELSRRGVHGDEAVSTAMSSHGPWRLSHSKAVQVALPTAHFATRGLPRLDVLVCR